MSDYKINVFELAWLTDEEINRFKGDFKIVVEYLRAERTGHTENWGRQKLAHVHEILDLLRVISNDTIFMQMEDFILQTNEESGGAKMSEFVQKMKNEGYVAGRTAGMAETENKILSLFSKLLASGKTEEMAKATADRAYLKKLMDEYQK